MTATGAEESEMVRKKRSRVDSDRDSNTVKCSVFSFVLSLAACDEKVSTSRALETQTSSSCAAGELPCFCSAVAPSRIK